MLMVFTVVTSSLLSLGYARYNIYYLFFGSSFVFFIQLIESYYFLLLGWPYVYSIYKRRQFVVVLDCDQIREHLTLG